MYYEVGKVEEDDEVGYGEGKCLFGEFCNGEFLFLLRVC